MDEDNYAFEMLQALMQQLDDDNGSGRMRVLSKDPRYAAESLAAQQKTRNT